ncbi:PREDICTED: uncharacterized protein LOC104603906 isoform X2 [Nelumbo nucifera]|uniref:Uncharacterized protein LOC104603906 isoform X2 n=1 Tax=Nelumbo nucifera TaxID=4432 RepID=A0A1U8ATD4_NELNU|nr:PREDICTED: uncharacterized protein LOC104603906 isoform X2 [Nelumbo nucifera]
MEGPKSRVIQNPVTGKKYHRKWTKKPTSKPKPTANWHRPVTRSATFMKTKSPGATVDIIDSELDESPPSMHCPKHMFTPPSQSTADSNWSENNAPDPHDSLSRPSTMVDQSVTDSPSSCAQSTLQASPMYAPPRDSVLLVMPTIDMAAMSDLFDTIDSLIASEFAPTSLDTSPSSVPIAKNFEFDRAKASLCRLLAMDFTAVTHPSQMQELIKTLEQLKNNKSLLPNQLVALQRLSEIGQMGKNFEKANTIIQSANEFLERYQENTNILKNSKVELCTLSEEVSKKQAEIFKYEAKMNVIQSQISVLQRRLLEISKNHSEATSDLKSLQATISAKASASQQLIVKCQAQGVKLKDVCAQKDSAETLKTNILVEWASFQTLFLNFFKPRWHI